MRCLPAPKSLLSASWNSVVPSSALTSSSLLRHFPDFVRRGSALGWQGCCRSFPLRRGAAASRTVLAPLSAKAAPVVLPLRKNCPRCPAAARHPVDLLDPEPTANGSDLVDDQGIQGWTATRIWHWRWPKWTHLGTDACKTSRYTECIRSSKCPPSDRSETPSRNPPFQAACTSWWCISQFVPPVVIRRACPELLVPSAHHSRIQSPIASSAHRHPRARFPPSSPDAAPVERSYGAQPLLPRFASWSPK
mmetsp:Transcript_57706/g.126346  ORF Transcript_57706/g.126346 Transcript_57706/m.126346 type:complete len:249 (+) Transcript_57706:917-1663(+)